MKETAAHATQNELPKSFYLFYKYIICWFLIKFVLKWYLKVIECSSEKGFYCVELTRASFTRKLIGPHWKWNMGTQIICSGTGVCSFEAHWWEMVSTCLSCAELKNLLCTFRTFTGSYLDHEGSCTWQLAALTYTWTFGLTCKSLNTPQATSRVDRPHIWLRKSFSESSIDSVCQRGPRSAEPH